MHSTIAFYMNVLCLGLRRRIQVSHPNLFSFIKHLQNVTTDNMADMERVRNGLAIRRLKKKRNIQNDTRIKASIQRFDSGANTRLQFLRAMCHCLGVWQAELTFIRKY